MLVLCSNTLYPYSLFKVLSSHKKIINFKEFNNKILLLLVWEHLINDLQIIITFGVQMQLESLAICFGNVLVFELHQIIFEVFQFLIVFVVVKGDDRDTIFYLICERIGRIVHNSNILQISIGEDPQILNISSIRSENAIFP